MAGLFDAYAKALELAKIKAGIKGLKEQSQRESERYEREKELFPLQKRETLLRLQRAEAEAPGGELYKLELERVREARDQQKQDFKMRLQERGTQNRLNQQKLDLGDLNLEQQKRLFQRVQAAENFQDMQSAMLMWISGNNYLAENYLKDMGAIPENAIVETGEGGNMTVIFEDEATGEPTSYMIDKRILIGMTGMNDKDTVKQRKAVFQDVSRSMKDYYNKLIKSREEGVLSKAGLSEGDADLWLTNELKRIREMYQDEPAFKAALYNYPEQYQQFYGTPQPTQQTGQTSPGAAPGTVQPRENIRYPKFITNAVPGGERSGRSMSETMSEFPGQKIPVKRMPSTQESTKNSLSEQRTSF